MAVVVYVALVFLYAIKFVRYPKKVMKEFWHPVSSNALIIIPCGLVLVALCSYGRFDNSDTLARALFWIGAPLTLLYGIVIVSGWIQDLHSLEHVNAAWLLPPTANLVCSFCLVYIYPGAPWHLSLLHNYNLPIHFNISKRKLLFSRRRACNR